MRQTSFSLQTILELIEKGSNYPECMLLNEVGCICRDEKTEESEKALLKFLNSDDAANRMISFCFLSVIGGLAEKHSTVLAEFRTNPENAPLLDEVDAMIERSQFLKS